MDQVVSIVAGGWSFSRVNRRYLEGTTIIGVNDSAIYLDRVDIVLSMDRMWAEHRWPRVYDMAVETWLSLNALKNIPRPLPQWVKPFEYDRTTPALSEDRGRLNGDNSGYCALNLAYLMRPREVRLFGFDMKPGPKGEPYWYLPYPWTKRPGATNKGKFPHWAKAFDVAADAFNDAGIDVVIYGDSRITSFRRAA